MAKELKNHNYFGIDATIIADSKNPQGDRITTMVVTIPRIVLAEFNTHRMFSRNSASSRAIPFEKMLERVKEHPFVPLAFQLDHKGMQGTEYITDPKEINTARHDWLECRDDAVSGAKAFADLNGVTKQLCNRLLEPFMWHTVIVTATEWENFFKLRCPQYSGKLKTWRSWNDMLKEARKDQTLSSKELQELENMSLLERLQTNVGGAEIHISRAAELMWDALNESTPKELQPGEWHIPFGDALPNIEQVLIYGLPIKEGEELSNIHLKIATARCARVSYMNFDGSSNFEADIKLHDRLKENGHASPFEHCAKAMSDEEYEHWLQGYANLYTGIPIHAEMIGFCRNFRGFIQYREIIER